MTSGLIGERVVATRGLDGQWHVRHGQTPAEARTRLAWLAAHPAITQDFPFDPAERPLPPL